VIKVEAPGRLLILSASWDDKSHAVYQPKIMTFFAIFAAVYNLLAKWLGGVEVEIRNMD
jgi:hypothetical protein